MSDEAAYVYAGVGPRDAAGRQEDEECKAG